MTGSLPFSEIPFSRYGSYFAVSRERDGGIYIRDLRGGDMAPSKLYRLEFDNAKIDEAEITMTQSRLVFRIPKQPYFCGISIGNDDTLHILSDGLRVRLAAVQARYDSLVPLEKTRWEHQFYSQNLKLMLVGQGNVRADSSWSISESKDVTILIDGCEAVSSCAIKSYKAVCVKLPAPGYEASAKSAEADYSAWAAVMNASASELDRIALYVLWGNTVHAEGCLKYDAMYMNKLAMNNIWSWDNCFGAIALANGHPQAALEQLLVIFNQQDESGALPDYVNDAFASYSCVKPPIYGFTVCKLLEKNSHFRQREVIALLYDKISRLTEFWLKYRMYDEWKLPCYYHGNDSGWDNASVFHGGVPVCAPDLPAYLICQMDALAELAERLDEAHQAEAWRTRADEMYAAMMNRLYTDGKFIARRIPSGDSSEDTHSLMNLIPILLWKRLGQTKSDMLVQILERDFEADYGLATESRQSPYYKKGGYWLGPIWAPVSYIFIDTLKKAGYDNIARRLAGKFCLLPSIGGMAENFDPFTGKGYDDNAFAWTASVYLLLREEYESEGASSYEGNN